MMSASLEPTIPRFIHRIWIKGSPPMPDQFVQYGREWEELHPEWRVNLFTGRLPLINQILYDDAPSITDDYYRFRADLLRLEILYKYGGIYVDTDVKPLKPFDVFLEDGCFMGVSPNSPPHHPLLTNAIIGASPGHPFIRYCIDMLPYAVKRHSHRPVAQMVGPHHLTRCYDNWERNRRKPTVIVYPSATFYPQSTAERDRGEEPDLSTAYSHHHWNTTALKRGIGYE